MGVDVFFVISGFVITAMLKREWQENSRINLKRFYVRRFKRLTPALALMVTVTMGLAILVLPPFGIQQSAAKTAVGAMLICANFVIAHITGGYFDPPADTNPLLNTWSLSVEEQFYLVFPGVLAVSWAIAGRARRFRWIPLTVIIVIAVGSFGVTMIGTRSIDFPSASWVLGFYSPFARAWEFAAGAVLALIPMRFHQSHRRAAIIVGAAGFIFLLAALWLINPSIPFPGPWTLLPVLGTALLILAGTLGRNPVSTLLGTRPMVRIGDWSYSIYLWHWPFIVFALFIWPDSRIASIGAAALSVIPAVASYYLLEQPIRAASLPTIRRGLVLAVVTLAIPIGAALVLTAGADKKWGLIWPTQKAGAHVARLRGCTDRNFDPQHCLWSPTTGPSRGTVLVAGDSQGYAAADGIIRAAANLGLSTIVSSHSGCPVLTLDTTGHKAIDCPAWQKRVVDWAVANKPDVFVITNRTTGYTRPEILWRTVIDPTGTPATVDNVEALYRSGLNEVVARLRKAGIAVIIYEDIPEPHVTGTTANLLGRGLGWSTAQTFNGTDAFARGQRGRAAEAAVQKANPGTVLFDPAATLCKGVTCKLALGDVPVYENVWHLSHHGSLLLVPALEQALRTALSTSGQN